MTSTRPSKPITDLEALHAVLGPRTAPVDQLPGTPRRGRSGHVTSYGAGRSCSTVGCATLLSMYNSGDLCALHSIRRTD